MSKERVQISYDIETNGATEKKSLPFVVGIVGDYLGNHSPSLNTKIQDRDFIPINNQNLNGVMRALSPGINMKVDNVLESCKKHLAVTLQFHCIEDFEPLRIIQQVPELKALYEKRQQLRLLQHQHAMGDTNG